jgi:FkbM family methyltransferase
MTKRHPIKKHCFEKIKELGIPINTILDVGVQTGTAELMEAFPDKPHHLFEPIVEWYPRITKHYTQQRISFQLHEVALSDRDGQILLQTDTVDNALSVTHARIASSSSGANVRQVRTRRLDTLLPELNSEGPYILKIDVDGAEVEILSGAKGILQNCNIVVVECGMRNIMERSLLLLNTGFSFFDIVDLVYYDNRLRQIDLVFINKATMNQMGLDMWKNPFDIGKWKPYAPWNNVKTEPLTSRPTNGPMSFKQRMDERLKEWYQQKVAPAQLSQDVVNVLKTAPETLSSQQLSRRKYVASLVNKSVMHSYAKENNIPLPRRYTETASFEEIDFGNLPANVVVKPNNSADSDCVMLFYNNEELFTKTQVASSDRAAFVLNKFKQGRFTNQQTKLIIEEYIEDYDPQYVIPRDFKVYVAGGVAHLIQVIDRNGAKSTWNHSFYDRNWCYVSETFQTTYRPGPIVHSPPLLNELLLLADRIACDIKCFMRLDFFISRRGVIFGEFTSYPFAGLGFTPYGNNFLCQLMDRFPDDFTVNGN